MYIPKTETLSGSATGRREWRVTPVDVERQLDARRNDGFRFDAPDDWNSHAEADMGRADIGRLSVEKYSTDVTPTVPTPRPSAPPAGRELG